MPGRTGAIEVITIDASTSLPITDISQNDVMMIMEEARRSSEKDIPKDKLKEHLLENFETSIDVQKRAMIALVFAGEKPGEEVKFLDESRAKTFEKFLDDTELDYVSHETDYYTKYFITSEKRFLDILEEKEEDGGFNLKSVARFRGLPEPIPEKIHRNPSRGMRNSFNPKENNGTVQVEGNEHLIDLAGFNPTDWDEMKQAMEVGERREEILRQMDRKHETVIGEKLLDRLKKSN